MCGAVINIRLFRAAVYPICLYFISYLTSISIPRRSFKQAASFANTLEEGSEDLVYILNYFWQRSCMLLENKQDDENVGYILKNSLN